MGIQEEGYFLSWQYEADVLNRTDAYGSTTIEWFYQGMNVFLAGLAKEYKAGTLTPITPYNTFGPTGANSFELGTIGRAATDLAGTLILTSTAGTPAASAPATLTAAAAITEPNFRTEMLYGPTHRKFSWRMQLLPYVSSTVKFFTTT